MFGVHMIEHGFVFVYTQVEAMCYCYCYDSYKELLCNTVMRNDDAVC